MQYSQLIDAYLAGPDLLEKAVGAMSESQLDAVPIPGKWSTRQVICHIADFELVYADRMKRVVAVSEPTLFGGDPDVYAARLNYEQRNVQEELQLVKAIRVHMARILRSLTENDFQRIGHHSEDGPLTLETLLQRITEHIPHHIRFIKEKRELLG
ncbi:MAG: DinB family protein [Planctomycetaceae bacterium]|nr:DinB family protein [Planctomycetales bacterium]MCB9941274.1 DinB family protein [Planctomycetaceae bacterium]